MLRKLKIGQKLLLVNMIFLIAAAVQLFFHIQEKNTYLHHTEAESLGTDHLKPLIGLIRETTQHQQLTSSLESAENQDEILTLEEKIDARLKELGNLESASHVVILKGSTESMTAAWKNLKNLWVQETPAQRAHHHTEFMELILGTVGKTADGYGLTLDPDMATFKTVLTTVRTAPAILHDLIVMEENLPSLPDAAALRNVAAGVYSIGERHKVLKNDLESINQNDPQTGKIIEPIIGDLFRSNHALFTAIGKTMETELLEPVPHLSQDTHASMETILMLMEKSVDAVKQTLGHRITELKNDRYMIWAITLITAGFAQGLSFRIARQIVGPVKHTSASMKDIAEGEGDLTQRIKAEGEDEIGDLVKWFNTFLDRLEPVVASVKLTSWELATSTKQMSQKAQNVSEGMKEQSASFEELTSSVQSSSQSVSNANELAQEASTSADMAALDMENTIDAISGIEKSANKISETIGIITEIADQTNLLALNAAIEAARAGEHGRGFAVVADEVRKLAERSAQAAGEIESLIVDSVSHVSNGVQQSRQAGQKIETIVKSIKKLAEQLQLISSTNEEQSSGMAENSSITESNASANEEMAQTTNQIAESAKQLQALVDRFKARNQI